MWALYSAIYGQGTTSANGHWDSAETGIEATKIIKNMGYKHPIVVLTSNAVMGQTDMLLANGFDDFIAKPIDIRKLNTVLNKFIRDKQPFLKKIRS